jgi:hypothetical protein
MEKNDVPTTVRNDQYQEEIEKEKKRIKDK